MTKHPRIVITGFMASGKTTIAGKLAEILGSPMIDLDRELARRERRSVSRIIEEDGESFFRRLETKVLRDVLEDESVGVIALGGGAWTAERNRALVAQQDCCVAVWLDAPFELCWQRIADANRDGGEEERPLARDYARTKKLYKERRAAYELAKFRVEVSAGKNVEAIAAEIVAVCTEKTIWGDSILYVNR